MLSTHTFAPSICALFTASTKLITPTVLWVLARWRQLRLTRFLGFRIVRVFFVFFVFFFYYLDSFVCAKSMGTDLFCLWFSPTALPLTFHETETGQLQSAHIALHQRQLTLQQVQEPPGQHHAFRVHPRLPAAHPRRRRLRLYQCQLH